ncbi:hypothetical protein A7K91_23570 [Paenibacillus oryzae]|uniref:Uncharacterized protein n=1 Tax=Paenibacillus oryzae TaxID=1844972 RepID=A0A1A5YCG6_9BACL|nr:hypothetical protein [Paenibacillus oryzae]OBR63085.1 hypothetical protein A7K91_23570 [Paenibacillus oryzae]
MFKKAGFSALNEKQHFEQSLEGSQVGWNRGNYTLVPMSGSRRSGEGFLRAIAFVPLPSVAEALLNL